MSMGIMICCDTEIGEEDQCEEMIEVHVEYSRDHYGGAWSVDEPVVCPGHELTEAEAKAIEDRAIYEAPLACDTRW